MALVDPRKALQSIDGEKESPDEGSLPPITKIHLDYTGSRGKVYQHTFIYRVPTLGDQVKIGQLKATYLPQGGAADPNAAMLVEQIAYITVTCDQKHMPSWWQPFDMYDAGPISALYAEVIQYERRFHGRSTGVPAALAAGDDQVAEGSGSNDRGSDSPAEAGVGRKAQAPDQRRETLSASRG